MAATIIQINRAPVLTLWAAVVAERLGFNHDEALSLGKALAGLNAQSKFGEALPDARKVLMELASVFDPDELAQQGFSLYEQFRPRIPEGVSGWGAKGELDLGRIRKLAVEK